MGTGAHAVQARHSCVASWAPIEGASKQEMGAYRWELDETPRQQCNTEGSGVGHLEVASRASLKVPSCDVPVQGSNLSSHGVSPPDNWVVGREGAHLLGIQVEIGVVHCILQERNAAQQQKQTLTAAAPAPGMWGMQ